MAFKAKIVINFCKIYFLRFGKWSDMTETVKILQDAVKRDRGNNDYLFLIFISFSFHSFTFILSFLPFYLFLSFLCLSCQVFGYVMPFSPCLVSVCVYSDWACTHWGVKQVGYPSLSLSLSFFFSRAFTNTHSHTHTHTHTLTHTHTHKHTHTHSPRRYVI